MSTMELALRAGEAPGPDDARTIEELTSRLRLLRAWSGMSYRAIHREVRRARAIRGVPEQPAFDTVYRCFQPGRARLDSDLIVDVARVMLGDDVRAGQWRQACRVLSGRAAAATVVAVSGELPDSRGPFTGRAAQVRHLLELAAGSARAQVIVAIDGMPGAGKTRLAVHVGRQLLSGRGFRQVLAVDLRGSDPGWPSADPAAVMDGFLRLLGVPGGQIQRLGPADRAARYQDLLASRRPLILLDNAATASQIRPLLPSSAGCVALITSRRRLAGLPGLHHVPLGVLPPGEAMELLRRSAGPARIDAEQDTAAQIAELSGHLPLALVLTAARIRDHPGWTLADHYARLREHQGRLRLDDEVSLAVSTSYQNLPPGQRRSVRLLALHPGGSLDVLAAAALTGTDAATARQHLGQLRADNLIQQTGPGRYGFHSLIRMFAADRCQDEESATARNQSLTRLGDYYQDASAAAASLLAPVHHSGQPAAAGGSRLPPLADRSQALAWLETERANLLVIAAWAVSHGHPDLVLRLSAALDAFLAMRAYAADALWLHGRAVTAARAGGDRPGLCLTLNRLARAHVALGQAKDACRVLHRALAVARQLDDSGLQRKTLNNLAVAEGSQGNLQTALRHVHSALAAAERCPDPAAPGPVLCNLSNLNRLLGRFAEAEHAGCQALAIARETGDTGRQAEILIALGNLHLQSARPAAASPHFEQALTLARQAEYRALIAEALNGLGEALRGTRSPDKAAARHRQALAIARELGNQHELNRARDGITAAMALHNRPQHD